MFKKTTLALAVSGLLGASAAQAAMVYDQDGTTLDIYGRIAMGIEGGAMPVKLVGTWNQAASNR